MSFTPQSVFLKTQLNHILDLAFQESFPALKARTFVPVNRSIPQAAFTVDEFCKRNDMCRATFYALLKSGQLKAKKRGARTIILAADEHAWLKSLPDYVSPIGRQPGKAGIGCPSLRASR